MKTVTSLIVDDGDLQKLAGKVHDYGMQAANSMKNHSTFEFSHSESRMTEQRILDECRSLIHKAFKMGVAAREDAL